MSSSGGSARSSLLQTCVSTGALSFGTFTLKSGRLSPYFFNFGKLSSGSSLLSLARALAETLLSDPTLRDFDVLFGPAYKGIPVAASTLTVLCAEQGGKFGNVGFAYNRKEKKDHGEGGTTVGTPMKGKKIVVIDDVITAGTAIREAIDLIKAEGGILAGIVVAFDRQERSSGGDGSDKTSTMGRLRQEYGVPVVGALKLDDVMEWLKKDGSKEDIAAVEKYREEYQAID
jgi:orotate phosphoribosyltransferase